MEIPSLGRRGGGWVVLQLMLFGAIAGCGFVGVSWPRSVERFLVIPGLVTAAAGAVMVALGVASLGSSFTPYPRPLAGAELRQRGLFKVVRHPVYGGVMLLGLGWSVAVAPLGLVPVLLLAALLTMKARREEAWLDERHAAYASYLARTPRRFVPWLW